MVTPVLRMDYRKPQRYEKIPIGPHVKVQAARTQLAALKLMQGRIVVPKKRDPAELPGGSRIGLYWVECKRRRRCGRPPYDRLLTHPVLRADYRSIKAT